MQQAWLRHIPTSALLAFTRLHALSLLTVSDAQHSLTQQRAHGVLQLPHLVIDTCVRRLTWQAS